MRFLKILFWILLGGVAAAFVIYNGEERVQLRLWSGLIAEFSLPALLILTFLLGFLPMWLAYQALRWRMRARINGLERALADIRAMPASGPVAAPVGEHPAPIAGEPVAVTPQGNLL